MDTKRGSVVKECTARVLLWAACFAAALGIMALCARGADNSRDLSKKNLIYMAYDDSGSMYRDMTQTDGGEFVPLDRWNQAKYALEVFSSMMLDKDEIYIFPLQEFGIRTSGPEEDESNRFLHLMGNSSPQDRLNQIESHEFWYGQNTAYHSVKKAYEELSKVNDPDTERWLVILTDGGFDRDLSEDGQTTGEDNKYIPKSVLDERFGAYAKAGVHVVFLRIFDGQGNADETPTDRPDADIHVYEARQSADTLVRLNEISNLIFKRQELTAQNGQISIGSGEVTLNLDAPAGQLVVFAQGQNISVGELAGDGIGTVTPADSITIGTPKLPGGGDGGILKGAQSWTPEHLIQADGLGCTVATFDLSENPAVGEVHVPVTDTSNLSVYVRPAVRPVAVVTQDGQTIASGEELIEGKNVEIAIRLVNNVTGEELDASSAMLSNIKYDGILVNDQPWDPQGSSEKITVKAGEDLKISGFVTIEQSSYDMEEFIAHVRSEEVIGELTLEGDADQNATQLYEGLLAGDHPAAVSFVIKESGANVPGEQSAAAQVEAGSENSGLKVQPEYDAGSNRWLLQVSCEDPAALLGGGGSATVRVNASATVRTRDDEKTASGSWDVTFTNTNYVGAVSISDVQQVLDGDSLLEAIGAGTTQDQPCLTFTITEQGDGGKQNKITPEDGTLTLSLAGTQEGNGVSFSEPVYDAKEGVYKAFLTCSNPEALSYEGQTAAIPYQLTAALDRGEGAVAASPYDGQFSFVNPEHMTAEDFTAVLEPGEGINLIYQTLMKDPDGADGFTVRVMKGEEPLPASLLSRVSVTAEADNEDALHLEVTDTPEGTWQIQPRLKDGYVPDFSQGPITFPVTVETVLSRGEGLDDFHASAAGTVTLSLADAGVTVTVEGPDSYAMRDMPMTQEDAYLAQTPLEFSVLKDGQPLTAEEWADFHITNDVRFVTKKGKTLKDDAAKKTEGFHLAVETLPEESKIRVYPWAESTNLVGIGSRSFYAGFTWQYTDFGIPGEEVTARGAVKIRGLPWYLLLWQGILWLIKHWYIIIPAIILVCILSRYLPRELFFIIGRRYGWSVKKKALATYVRKNPGERKTVEEKSIQFQIDAASVLCFWRNIEWSITPLEGKRVKIMVYKDGTISLTKGSVSSLKIYKDDDGERPLVNWGLGKKSYLAESEERCKEAVTPRPLIQLLFLYNTSPQGTRTLDLTIRL